MIDQLINPRRSFYVLKKYTFENLRMQSFLYLAVGSFLVLWLGVYLNFSNPNLFSERLQVTYYFVTLFLAGCLSSGILFSELSDKAKAVNYLLTPASTLEKFLCNLLFGVVVFFIVSSGVFYAVNSIVVAIANYKFDTHWEAINLFTLNKYPNVFFEGDNTDTLFMYFPAQAIFLLCSVSFSKHALFKAIVCVGLLWVCFMLIMIVTKQILPAGYFRNSIAFYETIDAGGDNKLIKIPILLGSFISFFSKYLVTPLLYATAYLKLKEKQL